MKILKFLLIILLFTSCQSNSNQDEEGENIIIINDTIEEAGPKLPDTPVPNTYTNERFRNVTVEKTGAHQFRIKGTARVFEAAFSWVVEDGHQQLLEGHEMTDAGAPEWGNFRFDVNVEKTNPNTTLQLILFEVSAKDGSRQYRLPVVLY